MKRIPKDATLVVDNGEKYSGHAIYFVSTEGWSEEVVNLLVPRVLLQEHKESVIAIGTIDWWAGGAEQFSRWVERATGYWPPYDEELLAEFFDGVTDSDVRRFVDAWIAEYTIDAEERIPRIVSADMRRHESEKVEEKKQIRTLFEEFLTRRRAFGFAP